MKLAPISPKAPAPAAEVKTCACFGIWQSAEQTGAKLKGQPGTVCWHDLSTADSVVAGKFYRKVFGWTIASKKFGGKSCHFISLDDQGLGGIWPEPPSQREHI